MGREMPGATGRYFWTYLGLNLGMVNALICVRKKGMALDAPSGAAVRLESWLQS